jgi:hypothetical protein
VGGIPLHGLFGSLPAFFAARGLSQDQNKNKPYGGSEKQNENYTKSGPPPKIKNVLFHQIQEQKV